MENNEYSVKLDSKTFSKNFFMYSVRETGKMVNRICLCGDSIDIKVTKIKHHKLDEHIVIDCILSNDIIRLDEILPAFVLSNEYVVFYFDNEEDAFYFKLKYC